MTSSVHVFVYGCERRKIALQWRALDTGLFKEVAG